MRPESNQSQDAFISAYDSYADAIYRHCVFRVFSKERAEELVQETFLKAWEYVASGKEVENMKAFLYRVATNLIIDGSRKKKEASLEMVLEAAPGLEPSEDGQGEIEQQLAMKEVFSVMQELRPEDREIITMRYVDELEPREIAELLGITPNNASVRVSRAITALRKLLEEQP